MKAGWATKTLDEACLFSNGLWKGEKEPFVNVGVIRNTNFTKDGTLDDSDIAYLDVEAKKFEKRRLQFGDIILEKSGGGPKQAVGRVALFDKQEGLFSFSNFTSALRVKNPQELDFRFLHKLLYWTYLSGVTEGMQSNSTGIRNLDGSAYKAIKIAFPSLPEQQRIVAILDEAFAGIATARAAAEKNRQNARALFESHLQSVFSQRGEGWVEKPFEDCIDNVKYTIKIQRKDFLEDGEFPIVSQEADFINGYWNNADDIFRVAMPIVLFGDHTKILKYIDFDFVLGADGVKILSPKKFLYPKFFFYALRASPVKSLGYARHYRLLKELSVGYPNEVAQQSTIADGLDQLSEETQRLEALYQRKLEALDELKQSLLHQAFNGEL